MNEKNIERLEGKMAELISAHDILNSKDDQECLKVLTASLKELYSEKNKEIENELKKKEQELKEEQAKVSADLEEKKLALEKEKEGKKEEQAKVSADLEEKKLALEQEKFGFEKEKFNLESQQREQELKHDIAKTIGECFLEGLNILTLGGTKLISEKLRASYTREMLNKAISFEHDENFTSTLGKETARSLAQNPYSGK